MLLRMSLRVWRESFGCDAQRGCMSLHVQPSQLELGSGCPAGGCD